MIPNIFKGLRKASASSEQNPFDRLSPQDVALISKMVADQKSREFVEFRLGVPIHKFTGYDSYLRAGASKIWAAMRAVDLVSAAAVSATFKVVDTSDEDNSAEVKPNPREPSWSMFAKGGFVANPNPYDTWEEMVKTTIAHLEFTGNGYWVKDDTDLVERPNAFFYLLPQYVHIIPDAKNKVAYYEYRINGKTIQYPPEKVIHFKYPHPNDMMLGLGPVEGGEGLYKKFIAETDIKLKFMEHGSQPSGVMTLDDGSVTDEEEWSKLKKKYMAEYGGQKNAGKCLGPDVPVLMFDGSVKLAREICEGDLLMGDDSTPRKVLVRNDGRSRMVRIVPRVGDAWECNDDHILVLRQRRNDGWANPPLVEMTVKEYESLSATKRSSLQLKSILIDYPERDVPVDPRCFGLWLGDGKTGDIRLYVGQGDPAVKDYWCQTWRAREGFGVTESMTKHGVHCLYVTEGGKGTKSTMKHHFQVKRIPEEYFVNSKKVRLELLAGLMDSDGHAAGTYYEYVTILDGLKDDVVRLANSLGFRCRVVRRQGKIGKPFWRITIQGSTQMIPTLRKRVTKGKGKGCRKHGCCNFTVEDLGVGDWCGWTLDGNGRFLLGDYTVTHNTAFLNGKWSYHKLGLTMEEMEAIEAEKWTIEQIFLNHGVPLSVAGVQGAANYAVSRQDEQNFRRYKVVPVIDIIVAKLNADGFIQKAGSSLRLTYELYGVIDVEQIAKVHVPLVREGVITRNELRELLNMRRLDNPFMDQITVMVNTIPIELAGLASLSNMDMSRIAGEIVHEAVTDVSDVLPAGSLQELTGGDEPEEPKPKAFPSRTYPAKKTAKKRK